MPFKNMYKKNWKMLATLKKVIFFVLVGLLGEGVHPLALRC